MSPAIFDLSVPKLTYIGAKMEMKKGSNGEREDSVAMFTSNSQYSAWDQIQDFKLEGQSSKNKKNKNSK